MNETRCHVIIDFIKAYTRMNETTFGEFVPLFKSEGRNVAATNADGLTLADLIRSDVSSEDFLPVLS